MSNETARVLSEEPQTAVRVYRAPRLKVYGDLRELTASGTGVVGESQGQPQKAPRP